MRGILALVTQWREERGIYTRTRMLQIAESTPVLDHASFSFIDRVTIEQHLNRLTLSNETDCEFDGEHRDYFPFLALPDEMIGHTFSFLSIKDRMRSRVNKRLNRIELAYKHYVRRLIIKELAPENYREFVSSAWNCFDYQSIPFNEEVSYSSDSIRRLTHNLAVGYLKITLIGSSDFHREVYNLVKEFDVEKLELLFGSEDLMNEMMDDSFFINLTGTCKTLDLPGTFDCSNISPDAIYKVCKMIIKGSTNLRKLEIDLRYSQFIVLLECFNVIFRDGRFISTKIYEDTERISRRKIRVTFAIGTIVDGGSVSLELLEPEV